MQSILSTRAAVLALLIAAAVIPAAFASGYFLFQLTLVLAYAIAILGLNLVSGYNGQVSLGHGAFYAIGAYTTCILMTTWDMPYWATLPAAAVICALFGFLIGLPALRLGGLYLALTTFALALAVPQLIKHPFFEGLTGGAQGLLIFKPDPPFGVAAWAKFVDPKRAPDLWIYLFTLAIGAAVFVLANNLVRGRIGRAMRAVRDHQMAAEAMGVNIALLKTTTFATSAMITGVAGSLGAIAVQFVAPDSFTVFLSITLFVGMVVGGGSSVIGALYGGLFVQFVPNIADHISKAVPGAIYGVLLILIIFLMPTGLASMSWTKIRRAQVFSRSR